MLPKGYVLLVTNPIVRLIAFLGIFLLSACTAKPEEVEFYKLVPAENINDKITLTLQTEQNTDLFDDCPDLIVHNNSNLLIRFPLDFGIHLYTYNDTENRWEEINNDMLYAMSIPGMDMDSSEKYINESGGIPLSPKDENNAGFRYTSYCANLSGYDLPLTVRVVVIGVIDQEDQTKTNVAAFTDVKVKP